MLTDIVNKYKPRGMAAAHKTGKRLDLWLVPSSIVRYYARNGLLDDRRQIVNYMVVIAGELGGLVYIMLL